VGPDTPELLFVYEAQGECTVKLVMVVLLLLLQWIHDEDLLVLLVLLL
jgi:hypothetical protein